MATSLPLLISLLPCHLSIPCWPQGLTPARPQFSATASLLTELPHQEGRAGGLARGARAGAGGGGRWTDLVASLSGHLRTNTLPDHLEPSSSAAEGPVLQRPGHSAGLRLGQHQVGMAESSSGQECRSSGQKASGTRGGGP